jgi:hypothetical protein
MTLQEIASEMLKDIDRYTTIREVEVPKLVQAKTHKKNRINKKWKKRYGTKVIFEKQTAKVADITIDDVIEFCHEKGIPLPDEFLTQQNN